MPTFQVLTFQQKLTVKDCNTVVDAIQKTGMPLTEITDAYEVPEQEDEQSYNYAVNQIQVVNGNPPYSIKIQCWTGASKYIGLNSESIPVIIGWLRSINIKK